MGQRRARDADVHMVRPRHARCLARLARRDLHCSDDARHGITLRPDARLSGIAGDTGQRAQGPHVHWPTCRTGGRPRRSGRRAGCALADARHRRRTVHQDLRPPARRTTGLRQRSRARRRDQRQPHRVRDRCAIGALPAADRGRRRSAGRHASGGVPQHAGQSWRHAGRRLRRARDAAAASSGATGDRQLRELGVVSDLWPAYPGRPCADDAGFDRVAARRCRQ